MTRIYHDNKGVLREELEPREWALDLLAQQAGQAVMAACFEAEEAGSRWIFDPEVRDVVGLIRPGSHLTFALPDGEDQRDLRALIVVFLERHDRRGHFEMSDDIAVRA